MLHTASKCHNPSSVPIHRTLIITNNMKSYKVYDFQVPLNDVTLRYMHLWLSAMFVKDLLIGKSLFAVLSALKGQYGDGMSLTH